MRTSALGKCAEICEGHVHRGMRIPGELPFIAGYDGRAALARTHLRTLHREQALCSEELRIRVEQELPMLLQGRRDRIVNLMAGAGEPGQKDMAHLLRSRAAREQYLLARDIDICTATTAAYKRFRGTVQDAPSPDDIADLVSQILDTGDDCSSSEVQGDSSDAEAEAEAPDDCGSALEHDADTEGFAVPPSATQAAAEDAARHTPQPGTAAATAATSSDLRSPDVQAALAVPANSNDTGVGSEREQQTVNQAAAVPDEALVEPGRHDARDVGSAFTWKGVDVKLSQTRRFKDIAVCQIVHNGMSMQLTGKDMRTLLKGGWLNSEIIVAEAIMIQVSLCTCLPCTDHGLCYWWCEPHVSQAKIPSHCACDVAHVVQEAANACKSQGRVAVLHEQFAHLLANDFPASLRYCKPSSPVWPARLGSGLGYQDVDVIIFPVHWPNHWVRSR